MKCHQILTGAVNSGDNTYSTGSVEGINFTVYCSGCNIVILSSTFEAVQIIPGILNGNIQVNAINASTDVGKIAACYGGPIKSNQLAPISNTISNRIIIFEPTSIEKQISDHKLDYRWIKTAEIEPNCSVSVLSWNTEGNKLLVGGAQIQLWQLSSNVNENNNKTICDERKMKNLHSDWTLVWSCQTSTPICHLSFSPDGTLFCSTGRADCLVKIWYQVSTQNYPSSLFDNASMAIGHGKSYRSDLNFSFIYIPHPRAVIGISWRKVSKYMPKGSVANMLVTSCRDNICRLWVQTFLPEDDMVNVTQLENVSEMITPRSQTQRHRQRILQFFRHKKFTRRQKFNDENMDSNNLMNSSDMQPIPNLPSTYSCHDFHGYGVHGMAISPAGLHFHLTTSINAENGIPLVPSLSQHSSDNAHSNNAPKVTVNNDFDGQNQASTCSNLHQSSHHHHEESDKPLFVVNWLNNKEKAFTQNFEHILKEIVANINAGERQQQFQQQQHSDQDEMSEISNIISDNTVESTRKIRTGHEPGSAQPVFSSRNSSSNVSIVTAIGQDQPCQDNSDPERSHLTVADYLDRRIESLVRDWNQTSDLLYSIHPLDGSLLVWLVEWLDESVPSSFRQPQISFSSRIPNSIPLGDASTMSHNVVLYSPDCCLDLKTMFCTSSTSIINAALTATTEQQPTVNLTHKTQQQHNQQQPLFGPTLNATPTLCMITKHNNGSLNLWKLSFSDKGHFTQLLSISHSKRVCGHRFRVNDIACHPILPLLVTTSHHNMPGTFRSRVHSVSQFDQPNTPDSTAYLVSPSIPNQQMIVESKTFPNTGFCSELILWKVEPVGPLMKSGGITELARINSLEPTAFANVAWIPTLLPSTTLGPISNSPSACFVASDGRQLRIYQAVIDARSLLAEAQRHMLNVNDQRRFYYDSSDDEEDVSVSARERKNTEKVDHEVFHSLFKIVSLQSTARPGCVLELSPIVDARHDWQNTQLLHIFQEQLIFGDLKEASTSASILNNTEKLPLDPITNLFQSNSSFEETFYLVVIEKTNITSTLHMWRIVISSRSKFDSIITEACAKEIVDDDSSRSVSPDCKDLIDHYLSNHSPPLIIKTRKVVTQKLTLPPDVEVIHATPSAGHLSSSNIYPACYAPFLIATACSDNHVRFWNCNVINDEQISSDKKFEWTQWEMSNDIKLDSVCSDIELPGAPLYISCAYSGRIACAFKYGHSFVDTINKKSDKKCRFINVGISIYECQSSGGSEWILEDTIRVERIPLIESFSESQIAPLVDAALRNDKATINKMSTNPFSIDLKELEQPNMNSITSKHKPLHSVPSIVSLQVMKQTIAEQGNQFTFCHKSPVLLDWVSTEDGSHMLTFTVGHKLTLFAPISHNTILSNLNDNSKSTGNLQTQISPSPSLIPQQSTTTGNMSFSLSNFRMNTLDVSLSNIPITRWMMLRVIEFSSMDSLPPVPMQMSWVRDGILVVGMDNEMLIFSQWKISLPNSLPLIYERNLLAQSIRIPLAINYPYDSVEFPLDRLYTFPKSNITSQEVKAQSKDQIIATGDKIISDEFEDFGVFESFLSSSQVIPQYHPKQLMELLSFGKIHRVRAILSHLVNSLCSIDSMKESLHYPANMQQQHGSFESSDQRSPRQWTRTRALSVAAQHSPHDNSDNSYTENAPIVAEEIQLDYTEIASIKPLPLYALIQADEGVNKDSSKSDVDMENKKDSGMAWNLDNTELLDTDIFLDYNYKTQVEETLDEFLGNRTAFNFSNVATSKFLKQQSQQQDTGFNISIQFDQRQARLLTKLLTHSHLPGLTSLDQMHLLALADSLSSFSEIDHNKTSNSGSNTNIGNVMDDQQMTITANSLDDCGLRYLLNMRHHIYLLKCLSLKQRSTLQRNGLGTHNIIWAFHSETQEELVQLILSSSNKIAWQELKELGVGFWIRNNTLLRKVMEQLAKAAFKAKNDPLDASLYYLAMKKKNLVWGLYRSCQDKKMTDFFSRDFTEDKWRKAAKKNAYALMGKQRFEHSVSFFLLAGSLWDAVEICINKLEDLQLAMVIIRLYEGSEIDSVPETLKKLLNEEILGYNKENVQDLQHAHPDPFLRSMAYWMLGDYNLSLSTLLEVNVGNKYYRNEFVNNNENNTLTPTQETNQCDLFKGLHSNVFNFYLYLRTQPLLVRRAQVARQNIDTQDSAVRTKKSHMFTSSSNKADAVAVTPFERRLFFLTAYRHLQAGCPALALEVLSRLPTNIMSDLERNELEECSRRLSVPDAETAVGCISSSNTAAQSKAEDLFSGSSTAFDWSTPASNIFAPVSTDDFKLKLDISDDEDEEETFEVDKDSDINMKKTVSIEVAQTDNSNSSNKIDIMAQQFKFISCLKIIMEELSTLATGFEVDGGQLRYQLYVWLERSVEVLKEICKYHTFSLRSVEKRLCDGEQYRNSLVPVSNRQSILVNVDRKSSDNSTSQVVPQLHEILHADKEDFQSKLERCNRRKSWLFANEALLRNLLSYCSLHGAHGGGLASVRMELILLLQELQQDRSPQQQLQSPLPLPTTLPLLTASVASQKTVVADPIRHLQSMAHDILQTLTEINTYVYVPNNSNLSSLPDFLALPPFMVSGTATTLISTQDSQISQQNYISTLYNLIHILRDLGISLSSCVYQSLCDCDSVAQNCSLNANKNINQMMNKKSFLSRYKNKDISIKDPATKSTSVDDSGPATSPIKWPGVQSLQAMIVREKDEDLPKLHTLLCEGFVAVYLSQLVYALTICDSSILYRLVGLKFTEKSWNDLFGGGAKKLHYVSTTTINQSPGSVTPNEAINGTNTASSSLLLNTLSRQRTKLHMKILEQLNQVGEVVGNVATSPSSTLQSITNPFMPQQPGQVTTQGGALAPSEQPLGIHRPTYKEVFVPPKVSIINHLMIKTELPDDMIHLDYDSFGSDEDMDEDETDLTNKFKMDNEIDDEEYNQYANDGKDNKTNVDKLYEKKKANLEYELYAWCIIRLAITKIAYEQINKFLQVSGLEKSDLPTTSPFIHSTLKTIVRWQYSLQYYMNEFTNIPSQFLPNMFVDTSRTGTSIQKYKSLLETNNSPFRAGYTSIKAAKRLWNYLVRQPSIQDIFIRYIFGKDRSLKLAREHGATAVCNAMAGVAINEQYDNDPKTGTQTSSEPAESVKADSVASFGSSKRNPEPMQIVHKDQDNISAFCVNRSTLGLIALSTPKEIQELSIRSLLEDCSPWMEEDTEMDILNLKRSEGSQVSYYDFLLVQHPSDRLQTSPGGLAFQRQSSSQSQQTPNKQAILIKRHKTETVRRLASHPTNPLYLSGGQDGCVQLWEWGHSQPISTPRPAGTYAKVTHVAFSQQGSKFGVTDSDGTLSLWQVSSTSTTPFWNTQCHNKTTSDFTFLSSSTLLMAVGHSTDHRNVVLVDTLLPRERSIVNSYSCHDNGASSIAYAPLSQMIITGGKKGDIFIFDIRQKIQKDHFHAHDSAVKCISVEPNEEFFATGSADGNIKVWSLYGSSRTMLYSFPGEHARNTFFRNIGMGVSNLCIDNCGRLFSCGADGSLKMRHIPTIECQPTQFFLPTSPTNISLFNDDNNNGERCETNHINGTIVI